MLKQQHYTLTNVKKVKSQSTTPLNIYRSKWVNSAQILKKRHESEAITHPFRKYKYMYIYTVYTVGTESIQTPLNFSLFVILQPFAKII